MSDLPAHHQHQAKTKEEETQGGESVLNPDHFVVGGEDVFTPKTGFLVMGLLEVRVWNGLSACLHVLRMLVVFLGRLIKPILPETGQ